jgi:SAM-dependent methyltransferase
MFEFFRTARVLGLPRMFRMYRAYRAGWMDIISGFYTTRSMQALFNVGFLDELERAGSVDADAYAEKHGLDPLILRSLCDSMYALSILGKDGSRYSLEPRGLLLVQEARGWFDGVYGYEGLLHDLEPLLRREKTYGDDVTRRHDFVARGSAAVERRVYFPLAIDELRRREAWHVLDLGSGDATFLIDLCRADERFRGVGVDVDGAVAAEARERVEREGLGDRIRLVEGDVFALGESNALEGVDAVTAFFLLHEFLWAGDDAVVQLLQELHRSLNGRPLMIFETLRPTPEEMRRKPGMGVQYFVHHDLSHQRPVGLDAWRRIFEQAGLAGVEERHLRFLRSAVFTVT